MDDLFKILASVVIYCRKQFIVLTATTAAITTTITITIMTMKGMMTTMKDEELESEILINSR